MKPIILTLRSVAHSPQSSRCPGLPRCCSPGHPAPASGPLRTPSHRRHLGWEAARANNPASSVTLFLRSIRAATDLQQPRQALEEAGPLPIWRRCGRPRPAAQSPGTPPAHPAPLRLRHCERPGWGLVRRGRAAGLPCTLSVAAAAAGRRVAPSMPGRATAAATGSTSGWTSVAGQSLHLRRGVICTCCSGEDTSKVDKGP